MELEYTDYSTEEFLTDELLDVLKPCCYSTASFDDYGSSSETDAYDNLYAMPS